MYVMNLFPKTIPRPDYCTCRDECEAVCISQADELIQHLQCYRSVPVYRRTVSDPISRNSGCASSGGARSVLVRAVFATHWLWRCLKCSEVILLLKLSHILALLIQYSYNQHQPMALEWTWLVELTTTVRAVIWSLARMNALMTYYVRKMIETFPTCPAYIWTLFCVSPASYNKGVQTLFNRFNEVCFHNILVTRESHIYWRKFNVYKC